ncbi:MAG: hypothetical protein GY845_03430 [Planctomycetes bacterium]|nr:hypothetical protein [Planctomycetota bacterium]
MANFGRALLGGVAGMAGAAGDVFEGQIKAKEYDRRQAILTKREDALMKLRNEFTLERDESQFGRQAKVRAEGREYAEGMRDESRAYKEGQLAEEREYAAGKKASDWEAKQEELDYRHKQDLEMQEARNKGVAAPRSAKISTADKKLARSNALNGINSKLSIYDVYFSPEEKTYSLDIAGKSQKEIDSILTYIDSKGFQFNTSQPDSDTMVISLGEFDYDKYQESLSPEARSTYEKVDAAGGKQSTFDQLKAVLDQSRGRSLMNTEQGDFSLPRSQEDYSQNKYLLPRSQSIGAPRSNTTF